MARVSNLRGPGPGRPKGSTNKGVSQYVKHKTMGGEALVDFYVAVFEGKRHRMLARKPGLRDQMKAADWLACHGFGRPAQVVEADETLASVLKASLLRVNGKSSH